MKKVLALFVLAFSAIALVACGGGSDNSSTTTQSTTGAASTGGGGGGGGGAAGGAGSTVKLEADPSGALKYTTDQLNAKAGNLTIDFNNPAAISHDVAVDDSSGKELGVSDLIAQSKTTLQLSDLKPGTYTYFCTVPGHEQAGMKGTLTVK